MEDDQSLEDQLRQLRRLKTPCPPPERLLGYVDGVLAAAEASEVRDHIATCGRCDALTVDLRRGPEVRDPSELGLSATEWNELREEFRARIGPQLSGEKGQRARGWAAALTLLRRPVVAYAIAAVLCIPAWRGLRTPKLAEAPPAPQPREEVSKPIMGSAGVVDLGDITRGFPEGTEGREVTLGLTAQDEFVTLEFFAPIRGGSQWSYRMDLLGPRGAIAQERPIASYDGLGNFALVFGATSLAPGFYHLRITETDAKTGATARSFQYEFSLVR